MLRARTAAAPISWGVCEVPGWGLQLPVHRVLSEMRQLGFVATELGATGYLPRDATELHDMLARHGMALIAGFNALPLADPAQSAAMFFNSSQHDGFALCSTASFT